MVMLLIFLIKKNLAVVANQENLDNLKKNKL